MSRSAVFSLLEIYNIDLFLQYAVPNEMLVDGNVFHLAVGVRIMGTSNGPLIVAPENFPSAMCRR